MEITQIIFISLIAVSLLISAHEHGKPKIGNNNFWISLLSNAIVIGLLILGGFFN